MAPFQGELSVADEQLLNYLYFSLGSLITGTVFLALWKNWTAALVFGNGAFIIYVVIFFTHFHP